MGKLGKDSTRYVRKRMDTGHHFRILLVMLLLGVGAFLPAVCRLYGLMVTDYDYYSNLAMRNQSRTTQIAQQRGTIYDCNMNILAESVSVEHLYLAPRELKQSKADVEAIAAFLAEELEKDAKWILEQAQKQNQRYRQVGWNLDREAADRIRTYIQENDISGIHLEPASMRSYPQGSLAAQVIGFVNQEGVGVEGVEAAYNAFLTGSSGKVITTKGNNEIDMPYSSEKYIASEPGASVILTLDATVQNCLERQLEAAIARYDVQNGAFGLVMNCKTGEILAMATLGSYDPNQYLEVADPSEKVRLETLRLEYLMQPEGSEGYTAGKQKYQEALSAARLRQWRNRVLSDGYEPGSTFKVLTMAAALDSGAINLNTAFYCRGAEQIPGRAQLLHCWRSSGHGSQQTPQALQNSCNIAFAHIALQLGGEQFYSYIQKFGILEKTGIDLAGESKGIFFDRKLIVDTDKWGTASLTSGSFGQTFKITPLQLVRAIASVVNGGYLLEPYVVSEVLSESGEVLLKQEPTVIRRTISQETSDIMRQLLQSVVAEGTAKNAAVSGYSIGGKTGTSEKIDVFDENGQRVQDKIVSFVGVAPMDNPEYIVLVALDTPSRETGIYISGGVMAAPTVGAVMSQILPYLGVQPAYSEEDPASQKVTMPDLSGLTAEQALAKLKALSLTAACIGQEETVTSQLPLAYQVVPGGSQVLLYFGENPSEQVVQVPDFSGMNRQQAKEAAGSLGLYILVEGNTDLDPSVVVTQQSELPGRMLPVGTTITLIFKDTTAHD